jgi:uncharacterized protein YabE (DUF348 family)
VETTLCNLSEMKRKILTWSAPLLIALGLLSLFFSLQKEVLLIVNGKEEVKTTFAFTVGGFLRQQNLDVSEDDIVYPPLDRFLWGDEQISIQHASQMRVICDQNTIQLVTIERTPANILASVDIPLYPLDQVYVNGEERDPNDPLPYQPTHTIEVKRATLITVQIGDQVESFTTQAETLAEALQEADISLYKGDDLIPSPQTPLTGEPLQIELIRAEPLQIILADNTIQTRTTVETVGAAISEAGLTLQGRDYTIPEETAPIPEDRAIEIIRVEEEVILEQEPIDFSSAFQPVSDLELDQRTIVEGGKFGIKASRVRVIYENGEEVSRIKEKEWTAKEPEPRVIGYGTKVVVRTANTKDGEIQYWRKITAYATSYYDCAGCSPITASGTQIRKGVVAVPLDWYRYMVGMRVYIPKYGFATIEDNGPDPFPGQYWVDLAYKKEHYIPWSEYVTVYFLAPKPAPENIMYILN